MAICSIFIILLLLLLLYYNVKGQHCVLFVLLFFFFLCRLRNCQIVDASAAEVLGNFLQHTSKLHSLL